MTVTTLFGQPLVDGYSYTLAQCDVPAERRKELQTYRDKRRAWVSWISTDEHHAIWTVLSNMVWRDAAFKALTKFAVADDENALNNPLVMEALVEGYVANQVLAIRRLMDRSGGEVLSLRKLIKDLRSHYALFTRENYICFDGLPYDYEAVRRAWLASAPAGFSWRPNTGPEADATSERAHAQFDKLAGIDPAKRTREDRLPLSLLKSAEA